MIYIIYKISIADQCYIGSTKDFKTRKLHHKINCDKLNYKLYDFIRDNGGWDCCEIKPIEEFECETIIQAHIREEYWRREYDAKLNMVRAHRTEEEKKKYQRQWDAKTKGDYYQKKKTEILLKLGNKIICDCGTEHTFGNITRHFKTKKHQDYLKKNSTINHNE